MSETERVVDCKSWPKLLVRTTDNRTYMSTPGHVPRDRCHFLAYSLHNEEIKHLGFEGLLAFALRGELGFGSDGRLYLGLTFIPSDYTKDRSRFWGYEIKDEMEAGLPYLEFISFSFQQSKRLRDFAARSHTRQGDRSPR